MEFVSIGETMVSFAPGEMGPLRYVSDFKSHIAGAESNTAMGLAKLGIKAGWISKVGDDEFGQYIINQVRSEGVDASKVIIDPEHRTGIMFKQRDNKETAVFYYRENSAASHLCEEDIKEEDFKGVKIIHLSGITPVLSKECEKAVLKIFDIAKKNNIKISFDPNIRKKLWKDTDFTELIRKMTVNSDIVLIGLDEAEVLFNTRDREEIVKILVEDNNVSYVAIKDGENGSYVADKANMLKIPPYKCNCIEPIGAGDGFNSGFIYGILKGKSLKECGQIANIVGGMATESLGDFEGYPSEKKLMNVINGKEEIFR